MADNYEEEYIHEILRLSEESIRGLSGVWRRTFDEQFCQNNFRRLKSHAKAFYNDLMKESLQKESYIKDEINELRNEAENLKRLLKTEVEFPAIVEKNDVPLLLIQQELDESLKDLRDQLQRRRDQITELLLEQESLCEELGEQPRELIADPLPTASDIASFREYLDSLKIEREERIQRLHAIRREIKNYLQMLNLNVNTDYDDRLLNERQIKLNNETFAGLQKLRQRYAGQVDELKALIDGMRQKLPALWDRLNTPYEERAKVERYKEYEQITADVLCQELNRCEELKRQNIKHYIQSIREEIEQYWKLTLKSDKERKRFTHFFSNNYSDELLTLHEMELEDLKQHYENYRHIYELYADRNVLWERMSALEKNANDPARYNNRGGQLLREEKERKTIATKLPKIEEEIKERVQVYEKCECKPFFVHGEDILQLIERDWEKKRQEKEAHTNARKNAVTPQAGTNRSQIASASRTPLVQRNASANTLRKAPSTTSLSSSKHTNLGAGGSALKRKLPLSDKTTPNAKRSLWKSPIDAFKKPTNTTTSATKLTTHKTAQKISHPPKKIPRVLATTIRRMSGRLSANSSMARRRSLNKSGRAPKVPRIVISQADDNSTDDENYDSFEKYISPDSRSSIRHESVVLKGSNVNKLSEAKKRRQKQKLAAIEEKQRLCSLPKPTISRTPSKQIVREYPVSPGASAITISRKLTTKNLPILI